MECTQFEDPEFKHIPVDMLEPPKEEINIDLLSLILVVSIAIIMGSIIWWLW